MRARKLFRTEDPQARLEHIRGKDSCAEVSNDGLKHGRGGLLPRIRPETAYEPIWASNSEHRLRDSGIRAFYCMLRQREIDARQGARFFAPCEGLFGPSLGWREQTIRNDLRAQLRATPACASASWQ